MLKRKLPRAKSRYFAADDRQPPTDSPTTVRCTVWNPDRIETHLVTLDRLRVDVVDGKRQVVLTVWPNVQLCTGDESWRPRWLQGMMVTLSWSTYIRLMKRRNEVPVDKQFDLLHVHTQVLPNGLVIGEGALQ